MGFRPLGLDEALQSIEPVLDQILVVMDPPVEVTERLGAQGVESSLTIRPHADEPTVVEDPQVPGDPRLADGKRGDERTDGPLAAAQLLDDAEAGWVR
jgi:hypothetical protein